MTDITKPETEKKLRSRGGHLKISIWRHNSVADGQDGGHGFANLFTAYGDVYSMNYDTRRPNIDGVVLVAPGVSHIKKCDWGPRCRCL